MKITKGRLRQIILEEVVEHERKKTLLKESIGLKVGHLPDDIAPAPAGSEEEDIPVEYDEEDEIFEQALLDIDEELGADSIMSGTPTEDPDEQSEKPLPSGAEEKIRQFLETNPTPEDSEIHDLAAQLGVEKDAVEEAIYQIAGETIDEGEEEVSGGGKPFVIEDPNPGPLRTERKRVKN